jgi:hypothetical protein
VARRNLPGLIAMLWPGERIIKRIARQGRHDRLLLRLHRAGPADVYADLLAHARARNFSPGWAYFAFLEIFGAEPRDTGLLQHRAIKPKSRPSNAIMEWAATCKRKPPPRSKRRAA